MIALFLPPGILFWLIDTSAEKWSSLCFFFLLFHFPENIFTEYFVERDTVYLDFFPLPLRLCECGCCVHKVERFKICSHQAESTISMSPQTAMINCPSIHTRQVFRKTSEMRDTKAFREKGTHVKDVSNVLSFDSTLDDPLIHAFFSSVYQLASCIE